jgi:hypothetical protein
MTGLLGERRREHARLSLLFLATRLVLHTLGLRFNLELVWMFMGDPGDLAHRLAETLYYFHAYPPGMNLLAGLFLKLGGARAPALALVTFWGFGLVLANGFYSVARALGMAPRGALLFTLAFSLVPQVIYFEHLFIYECPVAALLCLAAALFAEGLRSGSARAWLGCFLACAVVGWLRSTFHLVWFLASVGLAVWSSPTAERRRVVKAALAPLVLLLVLYAKNAVVFGVFGASSAAVANLNLVTIRKLPADQCARWVAERKVSPYACINVFSGPERYLSFFPSSTDTRWPDQVNRLYRPTVNAANFNHWFYLKLREPRRDDSVYYLLHEPLAYVATVLDGLPALFGPSTTWHPGDRDRGAPHEKHRQVLGAYEAAYNRLVHGFPWSPAGLYLFLPIPLVYAFRKARVLGTVLVEPGRRATAGLVYFCLFQIAFIIATSSAFSAIESARYRYAAEPMIWLVVAFSLVAFRRRGTALPGP